MYVCVYVCMPLYVLDVCALSEWIIMYGCFPLRNETPFEGVLGSRGCLQCGVGPIVEVEEERERHPYTGRITQSTCQQKTIRKPESLKTFIPEEF